MARWAHRAGRAAEIVGALLFAAMFALFIAAVAMRYVFGQPLTWSDEACVILLLWSVFWASAFLIRYGDHVSFDIAYLAAPPAGRRTMAVAAALICAAIFLWALPDTWSYVAFLWREKTPALQWRLDRVYLCFVVFLAVAGVALLWRALRLTGRDWAALL